jgi:hypothetical protein
MDRSCAVILGMHRSGTSALAGVLQQLCVDFGDDLIGATPANPKGHFELTAAVQMNDHLLRRVFGARWKTPFRLPGNWRDLVDVDVVAFEHRLRLPNGRVCGLKDPRMCRLVPIWQHLLSRRGFKPRFILALRRPEEVAASLQVRDGLSREAGRALWLEHICAAERDTRGAERLFVTYESLLSDAPSVACRLAKFLALPNPDEGQIRDLSLFLDRDLQHHSLNPPQMIEALDTADFLYSLGMDGREAEFSAVVDSVQQLERI